MKARKRSIEVDRVEVCDVEAFVASLLERYKPNTAADRYRTLQAFFKMGRG